MSTPTAKPAPQTGAELLVKSLEAQGVEYVFGIPGAKVDKVFDTLVDSKIKTIVCRHEQNAAFIASGIGRMTGKAGVALVTSGPGCSNLVTGFATATSEGDPVVGIGGAVPVADRLKQEIRILYESDERAERQHRVCGRALHYPIAAEPDNQSDADRADEIDKREKDGIVKDRVDIRFA